MRDASGATVRMIGTMQDISERKEAQHRIELLAYNDAVTGLPNRTSLQRELAEAVANVGTAQPELLLLLLNLNYFRDINVTAEGIEDESTYHALRDLGCDLGQGYFFSKPLGVDPLTAWLRESRWGFQSSRSS